MKIPYTIWNELSGILLIIYRVFHLKSQNGAYLTHPMLVKPKCVWEAVVFYEVQLIFLYLAQFFIKHHGLMDKVLFRLSCICIRSLVWILPRVQKISLLLEKFCNFFTFSNYYFLPQKIYHFSNTFWLYQHKVKYAPFLCYSHLKYQNFKWNTL